MIAKLKKLSYTVFLVPLDRLTGFENAAA